MSDAGSHILSDTWNPTHNSSSKSHKSELSHSDIVAKNTSSMPELITSTADEILSSPAVTPDELPTSDISDLTSVMHSITVDETDRSKQAPPPATTLATGQEHADQSKRVKGVRFEGIQDTLPRSRSYSGRTDRSRRRNSRRKSSSENHLNDGKVEGTSHRSGGSSSGHHRRQSSSHSHRRRAAAVAVAAAHDDDDESDDASSVCSTCSSSSSSTDDHAYQLPQRRHYGGVRVSYVPNDALACARQRKQQSTETEKDNKNCIIS